jgi:small GTP-binding protein
MNVPTNYENLVKILLLGDTAVGKSNILHRFTENSFMDNYISTIGFDFKSQVLTLDDNKIVKLQIWDTAGQERFMSITKNLYLRVQGIILVYDITSRKTFENIKNWVKGVRDTSEMIPIIIVGNKIDLDNEREVSTEEGKKLANDFGAPFKETSAFTDVNIKEIFEDLTREILRLCENRHDGGLILKNKDKKVNVDRDSKCC